MEVVAAGQEFEICANVYRYGLGLKYVKGKKECVYERINCQPPGVLYIPFRD